MTNVQIAGAGLFALGIVFFFAFASYAWRLAKADVEEDAKARCDAEKARLNAEFAAMRRKLQEEGERLRAGGEARYAALLQSGREQIRKEREQAEAGSRLELARRAREADVREWKLADRADTLERRKLGLDRREARIGSMNEDLKRRTGALDRRERNLDRREAEQAFRLQEEARQAEAKLRMKETFLDERLKGYPSAARLWAEFATRIYGEAERWLEDKSRPAPTAAETLREFRRRTAEAERRAFMWKGLAGAYEDMVPGLADLREEPESFAPPEPEPADGGDEDPARRWLPDEAWASLGRQERFQLALDRWKRRRKSAWEAGRDYERFVGWLYEKDGWDVSYVGALKGKEDMGRDLVARRGRTTLIIQCKRWSAEKTIHEKHVLQLFGTCVLYDLENGLGGRRRPESLLELIAPGSVSGDASKGVLACTCGVSDMARKCAERLGVEIRERLPMEDYPAVK